MRWLSLLILLAPAISHGANINNPDAINASIDDADAFILPKSLR